MLALAVLTAGGCRANVRTDAQPAMASLVVRNASAFDVNVYAVPRSDVKPVWLGTVPATGSRSLGISARLLREDKSLVIRAHAFGSSRPWTSPAITVDDYGVAVLDLVVDWAGDCSGSSLYPFDARDIGGRIK
jgi:hypothetical protein